MVDLDPIFILYVYNKYFLLAIYNRIFINGKIDLDYALKIKDYNRKALVDIIHLN